MKILITSGGTKVPIDPVRDITNMSKGTFGSKIAVEALNEGHSVFYLTAKDGVTPFDFHVKFSEIRSNEGVEFGLKMFFKWADSVRDKYRTTEYRNYEDYRDKLFKALDWLRPDIVILAAAVSDYVVTPSDSKIKSSEDMTIQLEKAEKIISRVKDICPDTFLVGFKLLVGGTYNELIGACVSSIENNRCDLVVGNDLRELQAGNHKLTLVSRNRTSNDRYAIKIIEEDLAKGLLQKIVAESGKVDNV